MLNRGKIKGSEGLESICWHWFDERGKQKIIRELVGRQRSKENTGIRGKDSKRYKEQQRSKHEK